LAGAAEPFRGGARLRVRLTPGARSEGFNGIHADAEGLAWLKAGVRAAPESGKANAALIALVAKSAGIARGRIGIVSGQTSRAKVLFIEAASEAEIAGLCALAER
jgi:hypothetical protein